MSRRLLTGLQIAVQTQLNCLTHQIDDCLIITSRSLLKRLDIALSPITQNERWRIALLHEKCYSRVTLRQRNKRMEISWQCLRTLQKPIASLFFPGC
jgi:hypothetical protein